MSKPEIILLGAGGHCRACIDVIEIENRYRIAGLVDRDECKSLAGYDQIGTDDQLGDLRQNYTWALITVGQIKTAEIRQRLFAMLKRLDFSIPVIKSPRAYVSRTATIGEGTIVMHDTIINAGANIGQNCIINTKALVEHDALVGDHCHISTGAIVNGHAEIGSGTFVGSNATCVNGATIPPNSFVKAGRLERGE